MTVCDSSSAESHRNQVLTGNLEDFWESSGACPHWLSFRAQFKPRMELKLWMQDRNTYTPARLRVSARQTSSQWEVVEEVTVRFPLEDGGAWLNLHTFTKPFELVKIEILENFEGGINCRVGQLRLLEASSTSQVTSLDCLPRSFSATFSLQYPRRMYARHTVLHFCVCSFGMPLALYRLLTDICRGALQRSAQRRHCILREPYLTTMVSGRPAQAYLQPTVPRST